MNNDKIGERQSFKYEPMLRTKPLPTVIYIYNFNNSQGYFIQFYLYTPIGC